MNDDELHRVLTDLISHLTHMRQDRHDSGLPAASGSGAGGQAPKGGKSKLPCSVDGLEWEWELHFEISEPAQELYESYPGECWATPRMDPSKGTDSVAWCRWLDHPRHRPLILAKDWDLPEWLRDKESELRHMLYPEDPHRVKIPDFATAEELAKAAGVSLDAMRKRLQRSSAESWLIDGVKHYRSADLMK